MVRVTVVAGVYSGLPLTETLERVICVMADIDFLQSNKTPIDSRQLTGAARDGTSDWSPDQRTNKLRTGYSSPN